MGNEEAEQRCYTEWISYQLTLFLRSSKLINYIPILLLHALWNPLHFETKRFYPHGYWRMLIRQGTTRWQHSNNRFLSPLRIASISIIRSLISALTDCTYLHMSYLCLHMQRATLIQGRCSRPRLSWSAPSKTYPCETDSKPWQTDGKPTANQWNTNSKPMENQQQNNGKPRPNQQQTNGKPTEK